MLIVQGTNFGRRDKLHIAFVIKKFDNCLQRLIPIWLSNCRIVLPRATTRYAARCEVDTRQLNTNCFSNANAFRAAKFQKMRITRTMVQKPWTLLDLTILIYMDLHVVHSWASTGTGPGNEIWKCGYFQNLPHTYSPRVLEHLCTCLVVTMRTVEEEMRRGYDVPG